MLSYIIVDDERPNRVLLKSLLHSYSKNFTLIGEADGGNMAIELINTLQPSVVFLDIQMPDKNGFQVLQHLQHKPYIIFVTAYDEFAVKAFEENAIDYLLKPVEEKRLEKALQKVLQLQQNTVTTPNFTANQIADLLQKLQPPPFIHHITVKAGAKIMLLPINEIIRFEGKEKYVAIYCADGKEYLSNETLHTLEQLLPAQFLRIQKGTIINTHFVAEIHKYANNRLLFTLKDKANSKVLSGTSYIDAIRTVLRL